MLLNLRSNLALILTSVSSIALALLLIKSAVDVHHWHKQSDGFEKLYHGEQLAHRTTALNYARAANEARAKDSANVKRVQSEQASINKEKSDALEARLADARARYDRLRQQTGATSANPSGPGVAPVSSVPNASGQPDKAALQDQLLATEQAIQLDELIKWVVKQTNIQVSK